MVVDSRAADIYISASSACLMIANTGEVLYEKNSHEKRGIASTTKIMTSIVALENCDLNRKARAKKEDVMIEGTSIGLKENDEITLATLIKGMLLESGNDAANVTATLVAGGKEEFALLMNKKAKELGMVNSSFKNPSGLTEENHYSSAFDMALLSSYAIKNEYFRRIAQTTSVRVSYGSPEYERTFYNHNRFLSMYDGAIGIKTGFTKASGRCLVTAVQRDGVTLVCVTLNASDDWNDHKKLMDLGFSKIKYKSLEFDESYLYANVVNSEKQMLKLKPISNIEIPYYKSVPECKIIYCIPHFVYGGIKIGDYVGWADVQSESGDVINRIYLVANEEAENITTAKKQTTEKEYTFLEKIFK